jgi:CRISPR/Cas system CSM-associated protein Csm3 (group 7 of RAMP superfamily)
MNVWEIEIKLLSDLHTSGERRGSVVDIMRRDGRPYLPASHVKGVVRTEAERIWFGCKGERPCYITDVKDRRIWDCDDPNNYGCPVCGMFGVPEQERRKGDKYTEAKIRFTDFYLTGNESERPHVRIDRKTGSKGRRALFSERTVSRGGSFRGFIIIRDLNDKEEGLLEGAFHSASDYGFGGGRSRGLGLVEIVIDKTASFDTVRDALKEALSC